eukprot:g21997.t1
MLTVQQALDAILSAIEPLPGCPVSLGDALGRVLADDVISEIDSPPFDKSLMDGYAVRTADVASGDGLTVVEEIAAGSVAKCTVGAGESARIMTGAPIPAGVDAVVPVERTEYDESSNRVRILESAHVTEGVNILRRGTAMRKGDAVLSMGRILRPQELGTLAELGVAEVSSRPLPRVAVLATGDELVEVAETPGPGQIRNSNETMLVAQIRRSGAEPHPLGIARDNRDALRERRREPTVEEIIASARKSPVRAPMRGAWILGLLSAVLLWGAFTPLDWGPLAWLALVPVCLLVRIPQRTRWMYSAMYVTSLLQCLLTHQWMRLGDRWMYPAWISLSLYLALYVPLFLAISRTAVLRFRIPAVVAVPTVWVAMEFARAHVLSGMAWYFLAHTQYRWLELIQISDVVGAYGVSFVIAMVAACLAGLVPNSFLQRLRLMPGDVAAESVSRKKAVLSVAASLAVFAAVLGYGYVRRSQADFRPGPVVALIQGNLTTTLKQDPSESGRIFRLHQELTRRTMPYHPDLIVWPETMYRDPLIKIDPKLSDEKLGQISQIDPDVARNISKRTPEMLTTLSEWSGTALLIGVDTTEIDADGQRRFNSAAFVTPKRGFAGRYDKMHLVVFGEYVPFQDQAMAVAPNLPNPGVSPGDSASVFEYRGWRFSPIICFEDTVPHLVRRVVKATKESDKKKRPIDCLVNMTNDGWFHGSSELDQHLITAAFRSVECRTPMVRAVNTGISAVIDGDGAIVEPETFIDGDNEGRDSMRDPKTGRWHKSLNAAIVHTVPLDNRRSLYVEWGDWFAQLCALFAAVVAVVGYVLYRRNKDAAGRKLFVKSVSA